MEISSSIIEKQCVIKCREYCSKSKLYAFVLIMKLWNKVGWYDVLKLINRLNFCQKYENKKKKNLWKVNFSKSLIFQIKLTFFLT